MRTVTLDDELAALLEQTQQPLEKNLGMPYFRMTKEEREAEEEAAGSQ
jgi:hypothetical protein